MIRRAEMLAELMRLKYGIAVAGSPRQDHHDHRWSRRCWRPAVWTHGARGWPGPDHGRQRHPGPGRVPGGGGRRERRLLPAARADHRRGHQPGSRARGLLPGPLDAPRGLRGFPGRKCPSMARASCAGTTPRCAI